MEAETERLQLASPAFSNESAIPAIYSCKGSDISPPLTIASAPKSTASLALVMHDPDAPGRDYLHWTIWNIDPTVRSLAENQVPSNAIQGTNDMGKVGYNGPCPPSDTHRYFFDLYALNSKLDLPRGATLSELM